MTYEELLVAIDDAAPTLPGCAIRLLLRLISICIKTGTNEVRISAHQLAKDLGMTRDAVRVASRALSPMIGFSAPERMTSTYTLPADWFSPQRSLFAVSGSVEKPGNWTSNSSRSGRETRPDLDDFPGQSGRVTRPGWATFSSRLGEKPGQLGDLPGQSGRETRPGTTQNQQLTDRETPRSIDQDSLLPNSSVNMIDRIVCADRVENAQWREAEELAGWLTEYMHQLGPRDGDRSKPDDVILAQCLAIAPLGDLAIPLRRWRAEKRGCGSTYAWFVASLANQIHRIKSQDLRAALRARHRRKQPEKQAAPHFPSQLLNQTMPQLRRMQ